MNSSGQLRVLHLWQIFDRKCSLDYDGSVFCNLNGLHYTLQMEHIRYTFRHCTRPSFFVRGRLCEVRCVLPLFRCSQATFYDTTIYPDPENRRRLFARSKVERRWDYITPLRRQLGERHPLVQLVEHCLDDDLEFRPTAEILLQQLEGVVINDPYQHLTKLDLIQQLQEMAVSWYVTYMANWNDVCCNALCTFLLNSLYILNHTIAVKYV